MEPKIEKEVKFNRRSYRSPHFLMPMNELWPNVDKMRPGDSYMILYDRPNILKKHFKKLCPEKTGKTINELNIKMINLIGESGLLLIKL